MAAPAAADAESDDGRDPPVEPPQPPSANPFDIFVEPFLVGHVTGIAIWVHPMLPGLTVSLASYALWRTGAEGLVHSLVLHGPLLWLAVLLHALCQCWVAMLLRVPAGDEVLLWPLGVLSFPGRSPRVAVDICVALAGFVSHVPQALLLWLLVPWKPMSVGSDFVFSTAEVLHDALAMHLLLALANLLPCFPFDASRVLVDVLLALGCSASKTARIVVAVSIPFLAAVAGISIFLLADNAPGGALLGVTSVWMIVSIKDLDDMRSGTQARMHPLFSGTQPRPEAEPASEPATAEAGEAGVQMVSMRSSDAPGSRPRGAVRLADDEH
ncbi:hypothetical protein T492DRAFT_1055665 [Pavlovales sp. CCMP2436]|nr:hypothetical protein T492DRAFT_1055665 [Pavlovales sp. CCMP2436]|mmetsp:Transcript_16902/g.43210  ORF Transcript_16902/g.43210 Transcript_16902/m.43210 type:complete len:326 (+) Transcript_16902:47-1024(+)